MKLFLNMFVATLAILLALLLVGVGLNWYDQNQRSVNRAWSQVGQSVDWAGDRIQEAVQAIRNL